MSSYNCTQKTTIIAFLLIGMLTSAQEKQLWATSFINKEAPQLVVEKWLSQQPETKGKFVLIDFWATWCAPCKRAIPDLNTYHDEFKDDLVVIGLSDETETKVNSMNNPKMDYYSAIDTNKILNKKYGVKGIPHCVIIDPEGIVRWEGWPHLKGHELTSQVIKDLIQTYREKP